MPKQTINLLLRSKILVGLAAAFLFMLGLLQIGQGFIETRDYRAQIVQAVKERVGKDITIHGKVSVTLVPPRLYLPGVELRDSQVAAPAPALTVEMLRVDAAFFSLFSGQPQISGISLHRPTLEIERSANNAVRWDWLNLGLLAWLRTSSPAGEPIGFEVTGGKIFYRDNRTDRTMLIENIQAHGRSGAHSEIRGSFDALDRKMQFVLSDNGGVSAASDLPLDFKIYSNEKNLLQWQGVASMASDMLKIDGELTAETDDVYAWLNPKDDEKEAMLERITNESTLKTSDQVATPLKVSAKWSQQGWNVQLSGIKLDGLNSAGMGSINIAWADRIAIAAQADFSLLDYVQWKKITQDILVDRSNAATAYAANDEQPHTVLPQDIKLTLNLKAQKIIAGEQQDWQNAQLSATLDNAAITINQFNIRLPGDSNLTLFGVVSQTNTAKGLRFEGNMEAQGKSLRDMLSVLDASAADLPETGLGDFYARSNLFISSEQVRVSEADVKINDLHLNGGLVGYFDNNPRLEADVRLKNINFDYFRDAWREQQKKVDQQAAFLTFNKNLKFGWLNKLKTTIDFKVIVDQFTFLERKGDNASFRIFAKEGQFGIYNLRFYYPTEITEASFSIDMKDEKPFFSVLLNTTSFDTDYLSIKSADEKTGGVEKTAGRVKETEVTPSSIFFSQAMAAETPPAAARGVEDLQKSPPIKEAPASAKPKWSEDLIDMSWMEGVGGTFDISVGTLVHKGNSVKDLKIRAQLENNTLNVQSLSFSYWQGRCEVTGSLYGGRVPGVSLGFNLADAELHDVLKSMVGRENITGKANLSGTLSTSGVNYLSWISQMEAKMIVSARGVTVRGLNLQGVVDVVSVARTAADVFNNVNLALVNGSTDMSVDGNINVRNGNVKTPGITLRTGAITGNLTGEVKLVPWTIGLSTFFQFPAMTSETVPTMTVQLAGPMEAPVLQTDTSSLEAYVAKRIIGR